MRSEGLYELGLYRQCIVEGGSLTDGGHPALYPVRVVKVDADPVNGIISYQRQVSGSAVHKDTMFL